MRNGTDVAFYFHGESVGKAEEVERDNANKKTFKKKKGAFSYRQTEGGEKRKDSRKKKHTHTQNVLACRFCSVFTLGTTWQGLLTTLLAVLESGVVLWPLSSL